MKLFWFSDGDYRRWEIIYADSEENAWKLFQVFCDEFMLDINDFDIEKTTYLDRPMGRVASIAPLQLGFSVFRAPVMPEIYDENRNRWRVIESDELPFVVVEELD